MTYDLATSLLHRIRLATQALEAGFEMSMTEITFRQFVVLEAIGKSEGTSQTGLVSLTGIDRSTMADIIRRLQRHGLVKRRRNRADARAYQVQLTHRGREMMLLGRNAAVQTEATVSRCLSHDERLGIIALLERLTASACAEPSARPATPA